MNQHAVVVALSGDLDLEVRDELQWDLAALIEAPIAIVDMTAVTFADTTFVNAVRYIAPVRAARLGNATRLRIVGASAIVMRMFAIGHLQSLVEFLGSLNEAELEWRPATFPRVTLGNTRGLSG